MGSQPQATNAEQNQSTARNNFESVRVVLEALLIALVFRTFLFQPFNIPSGSMEPTLRVGDYLFVSKFSYGYSRYSLPFSLPLISGRILASQPDRGDVVVFNHGSEDFIKRVIGLPGDRIRLNEGVIFINGTPVKRHRIKNFVGHNPCPGAPPDGAPVQVVQWQESLPNGVTYDTLECASLIGFPDTTGTYVVPSDHYFMMGDNRENSEDSRFPDVGYVAFDKLIGRAQVIFFSITPGNQAWEVWRWPQSVRWNRLLTLVR